MADLASRITNPDGEAADAKPEAQPDAQRTDASSTVPEAQNDSTVESLGGSGLQEPDYEVEVSLSALQDNEATPFHSATTWKGLGL